MSSLRVALDALLAETPRLPDEQDYQYQNRIADKVQALLGDDEIQVNAIYQAMSQARYARSVAALSPPLRRIYDRQVEAAKETGGVYTSLAVQDFAAYQGQPQNMAATLAPESYGEAAPTLTVAINAWGGGGRMVLPVRDLMDVHKVAASLHAFAEQLDKLAREAAR